MKRVVFFAYGLLAYVFFLGTLLYAMGFVEGAVVPKSINGGLQEPFGRAVLINVLLLGLFGLQHSIMARPVFKKWWAGIVPEPVERSTFVLLTCCVLTLLFWQWRPINATVWQVDYTWARALLSGLAVFGWLLVLYTSFVIDHFELFGLRQVFLYFRGRDIVNGPFMGRSVYKFVRHPLMLGFLAAFWSTPDMTGGRLLFAIVTTAYVLVAIQLEERDLLKVLGEDYRQYRGRTPMLLPWRKQRPAVPATSVAAGESA